MEISIDPISPLTIIPTFPAVAGPSFQIQSQSIPNIPEDDNRNTQIENPEDFEIGPTIHPEIPSAIETGTKPPAGVDAKLLLSLPILDNQNNLDPEPQSISVIMTNPDNQHYNPPSRSISPLAEHNTNNPHSCCLSIQTIESGTSTRNEEHEHRYQFRKRKKNNPDDEVDERQAKVTKALIARTTQNPDEGDIEHAMVAIPNAYRIDSELKDKIASNLTVLLADIQEHPDDIALPALAVLGIKIPRTYKEAISDPQYGSEWKSPVDEEITSLVQNGTWEEHILPKNSNLVSTKWVFTIKRKDSKIERFQAPLVARGFSQVLGKDYNETFAPTVRLDTLRMFLAIVAKEDLECSHFDIKNAFTESHLKEEIYLAPPQGIQVQKGHVLHALRSLYGLKQAGRDWSLLLKSELLKMDFVQSLADPCLYTCKERGIMLLVYVDDIVVASRDAVQIEWFYDQLSSRFNTKNLGEISKILGIRIIRDRKSCTLTMDQEEYLDAMLNKFGITHAQYHPKKIPVADYNCLRPANDDDELINVNEYQQAIGSTIHPMVYTRPDIAFALGRLSQYMAKPAKHHGIALKNLMRYLRSTIKQKLRFGPGGAQTDIAKQYGLPIDIVKVYTDADWASNRHDRKSISGGVATFYGGPISWASKKQNSVATSSAESEYIAMAMFTKQGRWIAQVLKDLGRSQYIGKNGDTIQMLGDNQGALALAKNPHLHERSKHIDICYHFIRDLTEKGKVVTSYINTVDMVADGMTKPAGRVVFERFKKLLGLMEN
jgi:hypothetical protein